MEKVDGLQILKKCMELQPDTEVIMITGYATLESAVDAMKKGAFHYIAKPFKLELVRNVVKEAAEKVKLKRENRNLRDQLENFQGKVKIITQDPAMQRLLETAQQIAPTDCNVLLTGESGTGKELFARYVHFHSARAEGPFFHCWPIAFERVVRLRGKGPPKPVRRVRSSRDGFPAAVSD
jgi:DNA-binding NtrC family response regulator